MATVQTLQALIHRLADFADRPCIVALDKDGITSWSYAEVVREVNRLAYGLVQAGVQRNEYVPLLAANRPEWLIACLAVIRAGAAVVPLDTQLQPETLERVLRDSEARFIFTTTEYLNRLNRLDIDIRPILLDVERDDERGWQALQTHNTVSLPEVAPGEPAAMFYTSGTTGVPKGVPLTHRNLAFEITAVLETNIVNERDRALMPLPMYHVYPFTVGMFAPLAFGVPIVLPQSLTGPQLVRALREGEVTVVIGVPRLYRALYDGIDAQVRSAGMLVRRVFAANLRLSIWLRRRLGVQVGKTLFRSLHNRFGPHLRLVTSGGSALDPELAWKLEGLGWQVAIGYGLTETSPILTMNLPTPSRLTFDPSAAPRLASAGKPLPGVDIRIDTTAVPGDGDVAVALTHGPNGNEGEILACGANVFSGYRNLPEETARVFTEDGWFRTGDLGALDADGYLYISGRASTLIVTEGGKNIQPEPVEETYQEHPFIREIGILQQDNRLVALVVPEMEPINTERNGDVERAIREAVNLQAQKLPSYQRIADYAITPEPLPRTNLGKIRRHLLPELYSQAKQGIIHQETVVGPIPLEDMSEKDRALLDHPAAQQVWEWLARRYPDRRLTPDTSPQLDLGIDSLAWLNLSLEISERTGVELSSEAIGRIGTIRELLYEVNEAAASEAPSASAIAHPEEVLSEEQQWWLSPKSPRMELIGAVVFALMRLLARLFFRVKAYGLENLPARGNFVITPNHTSYLDAPMVAAVLHYTQMRQTYWAGSVDVMFQHPIMRFISRMAQVMPVAGATVGTGMSSLAFAAITLKRGKNLIWFPEGRIDPTGEMLPFREGIGLVLDHYQVPVVPAYITGARDALPLGTWIPRPHRVTITFGAPCDPRELAQQGQGDTVAARIANALQQQVATLSNNRS